MNRSTGILFALLALPAVGWSQQNDARVTRPGTAPLSFDLKSEAVRRILRKSALQLSTTESAAEPAGLARADVDSARIERALALKFRADRRLDHVECDALQCYAYSREREVLFTTPRDPNFGSLSDVPKADAALSCLDTNDLLSTFERIDRCRGIGVGVPLEWRDGGFNAPAPGRNGPRDPP